VIFSPFISAHLSRRSSAGSGLFRSPRGGMLRPGLLDAAGSKSYTSFTGGYVRGFQDPRQDPRPAHAVAKNDSEVKESIVIFFTNWHAAGIGPCGQLDGTLRENREQRLDRRSSRSIRAVRRRMLRRRGTLTKSVIASTTPPISAPPASDSARSVIPRGLSAPPVDKRMWKTGTKLCLFAQN
jgi:hypothetical protein